MPTLGGWRKVYGCNTVAYLAAILATNATSPAGITCQIYTASSPPIDILHPPVHRVCKSYFLAVFPSRILFDTDPDPS